MGEERLVRVYLSNGGSRNVRLADDTTVDRLIDVVATQLGGADVDRSHLALRLVATRSDAAPGDKLWLPRVLPVSRVPSRYGLQPDQCKFELRVRYLCSSLEELCRTQRAIFCYLYDQLRADYLSQVAWKVDDSVALEMGCLEIRRFFKDMQSSALDKKSNLDFLESEIGLRRFFPEQLLSHTKPKAMRKAVQVHFKKFASLTEWDCMFRYLEILGKVARFDVEIFKCSLGLNWSVPIELIVGPHLGISYVLSDSRNAPSGLAEFVQIVEIQTRVETAATGGAQKASVWLRVSGATEPLVIACPSWTIAESLADLVDGYQRLMGQTERTVWTRCDGDGSESPRASAAAAAADDEEAERLPSVESATRGADSDTDDADYSSPLNRDLHVERADVTLEELLGEGQFGDVYTGKLATDLDGDAQSGAVVPVAVKTCKDDMDDVQKTSFLEEAYVMQQFDHNHIIKLIGVCLNVPVWIVMELAPYGELRSYLLDNKEKLELPVLLLYCYQLSTALSYLESRSYVHRDIAARNVLVVAPDCVKLSDFGLSRRIEDKSFYTASRGKLPIKWMAPESINFRRFTLESDVWMFGVCAWEILMRGVKPFQGVHNHDVIHRLESGERLPMPADCPPRLFALLCHMWAYERQLRPSIRHVRDQLLSVRVHCSPVDGADCFSTLLHEERHSAAPSSAAQQPPPKPLRFGDEASSNCVSRAADSSLDLGDLQRTLDEQRLQSAVDSEWLLNEEMHMLPLSPSRAAVDVLEDDSAEPLDSESVATEAAALDRSEDRVYAAVVGVVQRITDLSRTVPSTRADEFVPLVKAVGSALRDLISQTDALMGALSDKCQNRVELAEKLLGSDMQKLVQSMRDALDYSETTLDAEYRRTMLADAHVLAVDCKHFLETVDAARIECAVASFKPVELC